MAKIPSRKFLTPPAVTGNLDTLVAGSNVSGGTLQSKDVEPGSLSAIFVVDAETSTLTSSAFWQGSDDGSTWYDIYPSNNAAVVALATGTGGADASVTRAVSAPTAAHGFRNIRAVARNGVVTGNAVDTYSIQYRYLAK